MEHEILFILILLFFTVAVPPRPRNAGFQPPFPAETRFPDRESACESVTTEPRWNANDEKKYRWAIENLKISLKVELLSTFKE